MNDHLQNRKKQYYNVIKNKKYGKLKGLASIEINPTELCNRKCNFCPRSDSNIYPNRNLHVLDNVIERVVSELIINNYTGVLHFSGFGEPLLNKNLIKHIQYIKEQIPKIYIEMTTNGDNLNITTIALLQHHINNINVDCYDNVNQKERFHALFKSINFTKYRIRELWDYESVRHEVFFNNRAGAIQGIGESRQQSAQCYMPFYKLFIDWNGDILICCNDWQRQQKNLGNILTHSLYDIWYSKTISSIRANLINGQRIDNACKNCNVCGTVLGKESVDLLTDFHYIESRI